ncbi:MAG: YihY/virulence factor BrkB family protein [Acidimicrobiales bacterium]|nr:YihY/virulence factor BrkB family protein [Acidimicrobiales bacterium]
MKHRLQTWRLRWNWLDLALSVQERFVEVRGRFVASGVTISIFLAIFPLMLVIIAIAGFVAIGDDSIAPRLVENLGLSGAAADALTGTLERAAHTRRAASVVGLAGLAWTGSGVARALQNAVRVPWQEGVKGLKDRTEAAIWLLVGSLGFALSIGLGVVGSEWDTDLARPLAIAVSVVFGFAIEVALFTWIFWGLGTRRVAVADLLPGAVLAAVGFETLKVVATVWIPRLISSASALYGSIGIVFALLAAIAMFSRIVVYSSTFNVVRYEAREGTTELTVQMPRLAVAGAERATRGGFRVPEDVS